MNSQSTVSAAGPSLANAVVDAQSQPYSRYLTGFAACAQRFGDLGLPTAAPAAVLPELAANVVRHQVLSDSRMACRYLQG